MTTEQVDKQVRYYLRNSTPMRQLAADKGEAEAKRTIVRHLRKRGVIPKRKRGAA